MARSSQPRSMSARQVVFYYERKPEITSHSVATMDHKRHADSEKEILQIEKETLQTRKKTQTNKQKQERGTTVITLPHSYQRLIIHLSMIM